MKDLKTIPVLAGVLAAVGTVPLSEVVAGCPCQRGGSVAAPVVSGPVPDASYGYEAGPYTGESLQADPGSLPYGNSQGFINSAPYSTSVPAGTQVPSTGVPGVGPGYSSATATSWQPPPGTLGRTYQIKSRPIPVEMHPRAAIVDVKVANAKSVRVHDMNVYRTEDYLQGFQDHNDPNMWHFTAEPLIPGLRHIYRVEVHFDGPDGKDRIEERYVRMIMGRVIEIEI